MKKLFLLAALAAATLSVQNATADTIAHWTFELNTPADLANSTTISGIAADVGNGTASGVHANAASDWTTPAGNGSANSLSVNTWTIADYFQFQVSTIGFTGIGVSFDHTSSSTGPRDFDLRYSTDGSSFTTFSSYTVIANALPPGAWNGTTAFSEYSYIFNLSSVTAIDNTSTVYFRLVNTSTATPSGGIVAAGGTDRVDNFHVFSPVPEPTSAALVVLGGLLSFVVMRRRS